MPDPACIKAAGREIITIPGYDLVCTRLSLWPTGTVQYYIAFKPNGEPTSPFNCTIPPSQFPRANYNLVRANVTGYIYPTEPETELPIKNNIPLYKD